MSDMFDMRLSIRLKLVALIGFLLFSSAVGLVTFFSRDLKRDNLGLILQVNAETAAGLAGQCREFIDGIVHKARLLAGLTGLDAPTSPATRIVAERFLEENEDTAALFFFRSLRGTPTTLVVQYLSPSVGQAKISTSVAEFVTSVGTRSDPSVAAIPVGERAFALAIVVPFPGPDGRVDTVVAVSFASRLFEAFQASAVATSFLVDARGRAVIHPMLQPKKPLDLSSADIVKRLLAEKTSNGQIRYEDAVQGTRKLAAFRKAGIAGLTVVSETPESRVFEPVVRLQNRALLLTLAVLTLTMLTGYYFANSISQPLKELVKAAQKISRGDFQIHLRPRTRDEVSDLSYAFNAMARGLAERERIKEKFSKFHDRGIAQKILSENERLGGQACDAVILFTDIRNFTAMSEVLPPNRVVDLLNEYFTRMVGVVKAHNGVVQKYIGDALMVTWGVPEGRPDDIYQAVSACLQMRAELASLNETRTRRSEAPLRMGMGLNFGKVIAGYIGSNERMEFTVIGDTVNVASRVQTLTKEFNTDLLVTVDVYRHVQHDFQFEPCRGARVKGKSEEVETLKVVGLGAANPSMSGSWRRRA